MGIIRTHDTLPIMARSIVVTIFTMVAVVATIAAIAGGTNVKIPPPSQAITQSSLIMLSAKVGVRGNPRAPDRGHPLASIAKTRHPDR